MKNIRKRSQKPVHSLKEKESIPEYGVSRIVFRDDGELDLVKIRIFFSSFILVFFFGVLVSRLWFLQVRKGEEFALRSENNRVRYVEITAPRGNILDRNGREIVSNRPSFNVVWSRDNNSFDDSLLKKLANILKLDTSELLVRIRKMENTPGHIPIRIAEDIDWETVAYLENNRLELPGIQIEVVPLRVYRYGNLASHLIGYLGEINKKELLESEEGVYRGGDLIGKMGLEKLRERLLRGEKGRDYMEVNALGFEQKNLKGVEPLPGCDLQLTLDVDLQQVAEETMTQQEKAGAIVAVDVNSGRLLVVASSPTLQIEKFVGGISTKEWNDMLNNPMHPLVNKVVQGQYPPASTFKIVTALAGLDNGVITPDSVLYCPGYYHLGNRIFRCWKKEGHGPVNLNTALAQSCDVYFYMVGQRLGVDLLAKYAEKLGLGNKTGVEMEHEKTGLIPTSTWKMRRFNEPWQKGETLSVAIGQGFDLVTPIQLCMMTATVANGGTLYKPGVVERVTDPDGNIIEEFAPEIIDRLIGQAVNLRLIRNGLKAAVNGDHGTGRMARLPNITVAGKTGTAQVVRLKQFQHIKEEDVPYKFRDHAWFTCFAPAENPEIAVTVLVEHGMHGNSGAAPVAKAVLEKYFENRKSEVAKNQ